MRFRIFTDTFDQNPWFFILASYGQELAPATASYGLAGPDLAWWADNSERVPVRVLYVYCSDYSYCTRRLVAGGTVARSATVRYPTETMNQKNAIEFETRDMNAETRNYTL